MRTDRDPNQSTPNDISAARSQMGTRWAVGGVAALFIILVGGYVILFAKHGHRPPLAVEPLSAPVITTLPSLEDVTAQTSLISRRVLLTDVPVTRASAQGYFWTGTEGQPPVPVLPPDGNGNFSPPMLVNIEGTVAALNNTTVFSRHGPLAAAEAKELSGSRIYIKASRVWSAIGR